MPDDGPGGGTPSERQGLGWRERSRRRWYLAGIVLVVASLTTVRFVARETPGRPPTSGGSDAPAPGGSDIVPIDSIIAPESRPALVADGAKVYQQYCIACHGPLPGGAQPLGPVLDAREYLAFASNRRIDSILVYGIPGTAMVGWSKRRGGLLDDAQIEGLVYYIRSWQPTAPSVPTWRSGRRDTLP